MLRLIANNYPIYLYNNPYSILPRSTVSQYLILKVIINNDHGQEQCCGGKYSHFIRNNKCRYYTAYLTRLRTTHWTGHNLLPFLTRLSGSLSLSKHHLPGLCNTELVSMKARETEEEVVA